jgi:diphthamide synthase (EF-2-diphthine--ammonia ligase)
VWLSWSSGKDCSWALHKLRVVGGTEVVGLLTTLNGSANRVAMHAVRAELLEAQAAATGLPVHQVGRAACQSWVTPLGGVVQAGRDADAASADQLT